MKLPFLLGWSQVWFWSNKTLWLFNNHHLWKEPSDTFVWPLSFLFISLHLLTNLAGIKLVVTCCYVFFYYYYHGACMLFFSLLSRYISLSSIVAGDKYSTLNSLELYQPFSNEELVTDRIIYSSIVDWHKFVVTTMSKTVIAMVASKLQQPEMPKKVVDQDRLVQQDYLQRDMVHATPAQKLLHYKGG